jgi:uncharacterized protein YndB with AHSA1/START domain
MTNFSVTIHIEAPPDRVMAVLCDIEHWPEWTSTTTRVRRIDDGPFAVGSKARVWQPQLPLAVWQVTELDERSGFTWINRRPGVQITARHHVEENGPGSRVTLSLQYSGLFGPLVARSFRGLNERYLAIEATGLKERSEGQTEHRL